VPGIAITLAGVSSGPCIPDGPAWTWTCTDTHNTTSGVWLFVFNADLSVPDGTVLTSTITDDVAGLSASATATFKAQAFVNPAGLTVAQPVGGVSQDLLFQLTSQGPEDAGSVSVTVSGLQDVPTPTLPVGCQRSGGTVTCGFGAMARNTSRYLDIPLGAENATLYVTVAAVAQPNEWAKAPLTTEGQFTITVPSPPVPPTPTDTTAAPPGSGSGSGSGSASGSSTGSGSTSGSPAGSGATSGSTPAGTTDGPSPDAGTPGPTTTAAGEPESAPVTAAAARTGGWWPTATGALVVLLAGAVATVVVRRRRLAARPEAGE
jgi:hypothetical protein